MRIFIFIILVTSTNAYLVYQSDIPNGARVPSPCNRSEIWTGVGHTMIQGTGARNQFGLDFAKAGRKWTLDLCKKDSDGDGQTNGQELGDPNCVWLVGAKPTITNLSQLSHPGICEPIGSSICDGKNYFLKDIDSCRSVVNNTSTNDWCPAITSPDVKSLTLRFDLTALSTDSTQYLCQTFQVPDNQSYHIIAWEPLISNPDVVWHLKLFICDSSQARQSIESTRNYSIPMECDLEPPECTNSSIMWAFGMGRRCYGSGDIGLMMGKGEYNKVILQIKYANILRQQSYLDSSGLRIYYTNKVGPSHIAVITTGQYDIAIPPRSPNTKIVGRSFQSKECSLQRLGERRAHRILSASFQMHSIGVYAGLVIEKKNQSKIVLFQGNFLYDHSKMITWEPTKQPLLEPGDNVVIECTYQSPDRNDWTFYGAKASDEMCKATLEITPRPNMANFLEIGAYGLNDYCMKESANIEEGPCPSSALDDMIESMTYELKDLRIVEACGQPLTSNSTLCCKYLAQYEFESYPCVYTASYEIIKNVVSNLKDSSSINKIHANIVRCINALETISKQDFEAGKKRKLKSVAAANIVPNDKLLALVSALLFFATFEEPIIRSLQL